MTPRHAGGDPDMCPGCRQLPARDVPAILCPGPQETPVTSPTSPLLTVLDGLVPLHIMRLTRPGELSRAHAEAQDLGDLLTEGGDRLTNPAAFRAAADRHTRGQLLSAMATCLALGARQDGGITWSGRHWCTTQHPDCPSTRKESA